MGCGLSVAASDAHKDYPFGDAQPNAPCPRSDIKDSAGSFKKRKDSELVTVKSPTRTGAGSSPSGPSLVDSPFMRGDSEGSQTSKAVPSSSGQRTEGNDSAKAPAAPSSGSETNGHSDGMSSMADMSYSEDEYPMPSMLPVTESERLGIIRGGKMLDSAGQDPRLNGIAKLCASVFNVPYAGIILVEEKVCRSKTAYGYPISLCTPRGVAMCSWSLLNNYNEVFVTEDASKDDRFCTNPVVKGAPFIRFYAGAPLRSLDGVKLGNLCLMDTKPKQLSPPEAMILANFGEMCVRLMEEETIMARRNAQIKHAMEENVKLTRAMEGVQEAVLLVDVSSDTWSVAFANHRAMDLLGLEKNAVEGASLWKIARDVRGRGAEAYRGAVGDRVAFSITLARCLSSGATLLFDVRCKSAETPMDTTAETISTAQARATQPVHIGDANYYLLHFTQVRKSSSGDPPGAYPSSSSSVDHGLHSGSHNMMSPVGHNAATADVLKTLQTLGPAKEPFVDVKLGAVLGSGGYGRVFKGMWDGTRVAVKVIEAPKKRLFPEAYSVEEEDDTVANFNPLFEAMLSMHISHPNVVLSYKYSSRPVVKPLAPGEKPADLDDGEQMYETWIVSEYCDKGSLQDALWKTYFLEPDTGAVDMEAVINTIREIVSAIKYMHGRGILHGDLSANNVMLISSQVDHRGFVAKVCDFGLSRIAPKGGSVTQNFGTCTHMAPEVLVEGQVSEKADIYSLGVIMFQLATLTPDPWGKGNHATIINRMLNAGGAPSFPPGYPHEDFKELTLRCVSTYPQHRPTTSQILEALEAMQSDY